jgi:hypothetical protein
VWRIANVAPFDPAAPPVLENVSVSWSTYSPPPLAPGGANGTMVRTGDAQIAQTLASVTRSPLCTRLPASSPANTPFESCFRAVRFTVGQVNGTMTVTKSELQGCRWATRIAKVTP